jgi:hypothetical protein
MVYKNPNTNENEYNLHPMQTEKKQRTKGVCHTVALPFTFLKNILRQKKNYENSNIFPDAKKKFKKSSKKSSERNQNP